MSAAIMKKNHPCGELVHLDTASMICLAEKTVSKLQAMLIMPCYEQAAPTPVYEEPVTDNKPFSDGTETDDEPVYEMEVTPTNDGKKKRGKIEEDKNAGYE